MGTPDPCCVDCVVCKPGTTPYEYEAEISGVKNKPGSPPPCSNCADYNAKWKLCQRYLCDYDLWEGLPCGHACLHLELSYDPELDVVFGLHVLRYGPSVEAGSLLYLPYKVGEVDCEDSFTFTDFFSFANSECDWDDAVATINFVFPPSPSCD